CLPDAPNCPGCQVFPICVTDEPPPVDDCAALPVERCEAVEGCAIFSVEDCQCDNDTCGCAIRDYCDVATALPACEAIFEGWVCVHRQDCQWIEEAPVDPCVCWVDENGQEVCDCAAQGKMPARMPPGVCLPLDCAALAPDVCLSTAGCDLLQAEVNCAACLPGEPCPPCEPPPPICVPTPTSCASIHYAFCEQIPGCALMERAEPCPPCEPCVEGEPCEPCPVCPPPLPPACVDEADLRAP
ncbi:hypothetical protein KKF91_19945, partial [Myxococcota bacterium]|nr:hypothetical protein [Myxococcota bacterium]